MRKLAHIVVALGLLGCKRGGEPEGPFRMRNTPTTVRTEQLVKPAAAPISVALAPDAKQYAYTTARGELYVRPLAGGDAKRWTPKLDGAVAVYVAGFYSDGALAVLSTTEANEWRLHRVTEAAATLVHTAPSRLHAAIAGERTIVATETAISEVTASGLRPIASLQPGERILAIAVSPDGTRIANMRDLPNEVTEAVYVTSLDGRDLGRQQRFGSSPGYGNELLAWIDNTRFVFAGADRENEEHGVQVYGAGVEDGLPETRDVWPVDGYVGLGSAANGVLLVVRGRAAPGVMTGPAAALARVAGATRVVGWTSDNRVVYTTGPWREERIMRGTEPWPGTQNGDAGVAIAGDAVILHRMGGNGFDVERLDGAGKRTRLAQLSMANVRWRPQLVRCAGERAAPCVIEHVEYANASYFEFDPVTGKRGALLHAHDVKYPTGPTPDVALSPDGKLLAVVDESPAITLVAGKQTHVTKLDGVAAIDSITFASNGEVFASARGVRGRPFAVLRLTLDPKTMQLRAEPVASDALRVYARPTRNVDGQLATGVRDLQTDVTRVDGL